MAATNEDKRQAVLRELKYRRNVYPRWVAAGRMSPEEAARQIAIFEEIEADYAALVVKERLL